MQVPVLRRFRTHITMLLISVVFLATAVEGFYSTPLDHGTGSAPSCFEAFSKVVTTCGLDMRMGMSLSISKAKGGMTMEPNDMMMTIPDSAAPDYCSGSCSPTWQGSARATTRLRPRSRPHG